MPLATQAKLLSAIQEHTVTRLGSETPIRVSVQLVCATHEDLLQIFDTCEKLYIEESLAAYAWRVGRAAEALGISRKTLWEEMRKHSIADRTKGAVS